METGNPSSVMNIKAEAIPDEWHPAWLEGKAPCGGCLIIILS